MQAKPTPPASRFTTWLPFLLALSLSLGIIIGMRLSGPDSGDVLAREQTDGRHKLEELLRYIEARYVDKIDRQKLVDETISTILRQLDPHSSYISPEELAKINEQMEGEFLGIGVEFMTLNDTFIVVSVLKGSPAQKAGILAGDKIISIQDSLISGKKWKSEDVVKILRNEKNPKVRIGLLRYPNKTQTVVSVTRKQIPIKSVDAAYWINNQVAYIRINRFSSTTDKEFLSALEQLSSRNKAINLILDLRHNPGGYLQQATNILSQIFPERGEILVYTQGQAINRSDYHSTGRAFFDIAKIAVLIDEGSASASEIIAGAVQDHDRGLIIGRRSYGKGLVQEQYRMGDGSAIRLTVARYYTPSGRSIQKPYSKSEMAADETQVTAFSKIPPDQGQIVFSDSTKYFTNAGRIVYSGGGITPDIFVPADSTEGSPVFQEIQQRLPVFSLKGYSVAKDRFQGKRQAFFDHFTVEEKNLDELYQFLNASGLEVPRQEWAIIRDKMPRMIKAHIARNLFGTEAYFQVLNEGDPFIYAAQQQLLAQLKK